MPRIRQRFSISSPAPTIPRRTSSKGKSAAAAIVPSSGGSPKGPLGLLPSALFNEADTYPPAAMRKGDKPVLTFKSRKYLKKHL
jgi:hypothetical protein